MPEIFSANQIAYYSGVVDASGGVSGPWSGWVRKEHNLEAYATADQELCAPGRYEEALKFAEQAYSLDPLIVETNLQLGYLFPHTGQPEKAMETARSLIELYPG